MYVWDINGTLFQNIYETPDWDNPLAVHPQTGESVTGQMPIYNQGNYLHPDLEGILLTIDTVLTVRPEYRRSVTIDQLKTLTNNTPETLIMYPARRRYTHHAALLYKINHLDYMAAVSPDRVYYIDEDEDTRAVINSHEIYSRREPRVEAISLDRYFDLEVGL